MGIDVASAPMTRQPPVRRRDASASGRPIGAFELAVLAAFACVSVWVLALDVFQVVAHNRVWTGTDGLFLADQMQYLAWIQDASKHVLASNMFVLRSTPHDYFQPIVIVSAAITRLGVAPWLALLLWKPVAVLACFAAVLAYTRRTLSDRFDRRAALVLALFFGSWGVLGDEWLPFSSWGYPFALLAVAALAAGLLVYDRARSERRLIWIAPALGMFASLAHPWQGELLILTVIGAEAVMWKGRERLRKRLVLPSITVVATLLPLVYYELLDRLDSNWEGAQIASKHHYSLSGILLPLLPLLIAAALAYRRRPDSFISAATRVWPIAALAIFGLSQTGLAGTPLHAFNGITVPLAVLAIEGVQGLGFRRIPAWRLAGVALVAAATIPASVTMIAGANGWVRPWTYRATFIPHGERRAFRYLAHDKRPGGVLARATYVGLVVPAQTGRRTYAGTCLWSRPHCQLRIINTENLFRGNVSPTQARAFVRSTGARFLLEDCNSHGDLNKLLGNMVVSERRFGCASVYEVRKA
jgi:hypothetical protein